MHDEAIRYASEIGPRITDNNGIFKEPRATYYLTKTELKKLFSKNGFNTNGVSWLKMIITWGEVWEELTPSPASILNRNYESWLVCFVDLTESDRSRLYLYADNNNVRTFPKVAE